MLIAMTITIFMTILIILIIIVGFYFLFSPTSQDCPRLAETCRSKHNKTRKNMYYDYFSYYYYDGYP